jgi:hypothetical protein
LKNAMLPESPALRPVVGFEPIDGANTRKRRLETASSAGGR